MKIGGIKPGILRYLGTTHLAPGIFCGIELLEADGNHDGEVNGHRYFYCPPNCGIFAPKEKVCIDTSVSSRLSSESDGNLYSSNESLTERTYKAFRSFEEGELEAVDCSVLSPESPHGEPGKRKRNEAETPPDWGSRSTDSIDSQDSSYFQGRPKSYLPRSGKGSNIPSPQGHSLKSPGSGGSSFGYHKPREDTNPLHQQGKTVFDLKGRDYQYSERGRVAPRAHEIGKERLVCGEDAEDEDENEGSKYFTRSKALRHAGQYQSRSNNKQYLNFAFDPSESQPQRTSDWASSTDKSSHHNRRSYSHHQADPKSSQKREPKLDSTFEVIRSPLPSSHPANSTFEITSPSIASVRDGRDSVPLTSTPEPGHGAPRFEGGPVVPFDQQRAGPSSSFSGSETDTDDTGRRLSVTYSLSDSQVQASKTLLHEDDGHGASLGGQHVKVPPGEDTTSSGSYIGSEQQSAYQKGGYTSSGPSRCGGDGNSRGLLPSQSHAPSSSRKSASCIVSSQGDEHSYDVIGALSYTVCAGQKDSVQTTVEVGSADSVDVTTGNIITVTEQENVHKTDAEKEIKTPVIQGESGARNNSHISPQLTNSENNVVVAAAASLSYTVGRSHSPSLSGRKVSSAGSSHEENGESSSSSGPPSSGGGDHRQDHLDDSSTGVSPEVSQALEWDYGQEFVDGKIPPPLSRHHLNRHARNHSCDAATIMTTSSSTGTSESLSDALLRDVSSEPSSDTEMTPASSCSLADDSDQFEPPENDFENIDSLEDLDFPMLGKISAIPSTSASTAGVSTSFATAVEMTAPPATVMTDSGISERDESEMFKSTTSATSTSTLCGGGAGDNSFSDDCSRDDDHSSSSVLAGNPAVSSSTTPSTSSATSRGVGSDSSQETLCVPDTPGSVEDKEFLSEDGEGDMDHARLKPLPSVKGDAEHNRTRGDSCGEDVDITSGSPVSVVSLEDVSLVQDRTVVCDPPGKDPSRASTTNILPSAVLSTSDKVADTGIAQVTPRRESANVHGGEQLSDIQDPAGLLSNRRERPVSLISTTSADTGTRHTTAKSVCGLTVDSSPLPSRS